MIRTHLRQACFAVLHDPPVRKLPKELLERVRNERPMRIHTGIPGLQLQVPAQKVLDQSENIRMWCMERVTADVEHAAAPLN